MTAVWGGGVCDGSDNVCGTNGLGQAVACNGLDRTVCLKGDVCVSECRSGSACNIGQYADGACCSQDCGPA